jgi:hypothetical protein
MLSKTYEKVRTNGTRSNWGKVAPDMWMATALGRLTDGWCSFVEANSTRKEAVLRVIEDLRAAQIQVLGAVLN